MKKSDKIKVFISFLFIVFPILSQAEVSAKNQDLNNVSLIRLKKFTPPNTILATGTVEPIEKATLKFENFGKIQSILEEGTEIKGNIFGKDGKVINQGTLIAQQNDHIEKADFEAAQAALEKAKLKVKQAKDEYDRNKKLVIDHAVSQKVFEEAEIAYLQANSDLKDAVQNLTKATFELSTNYMYSSFDAVVNKTYQTSNIWYEGFHNTASIQMMDPIAIKIPIEYISDVNHLTDKPILYSPSSDARINDWLCDYTQLEGNKYYHYFVVPNKKITFYNNLPKQYASLPKVGWVCRLVYFDSESNTLAVPVDAISIVKDKEYVWVMKEHFIEDKDNTINYKTYIANKIQIETGKRIKDIGIYKIVEITNSQGLKITDTIMWDKIPKDLKDGDTVLLDPKKWKIAPGDEIKVLINLIPMKTGFYVPLDAITVNPKGETSIVLKNDEFITVKIEGQFANLVLISSDKLKEDMFVKQNPARMDTILRDFMKEITVK